MAIGKSEEYPLRAEKAEGKRKSGSRLKIAIGVVVVLLIAAAIVVAVIFISRSIESPQVEIDCFILTGEESDGAYVFKGIPYAEPPVGELRWKPPKPIKTGSAKCDKSERNATEFQSSCFQGTMVDETDHYGSEDCLFINVWTPTLDASKKLPVMVWIHGGYLMTLEGGTPTYSPTAALAKETDIVYVSMNYRLNAFGFMALEMLSAESSTNTSGNYGFMDQILALEWVQRNVAVFGGDSNRVTVFGQSSGGTSIHALLGIPKAKGLFQGAWLMSGSSIMNASLAEAEAANQNFLDNTRCLNTTCLRNLTPTQVHNAVPWRTYPFWAMIDLFDLPVNGEFDGPVAVVDGVLIPNAPMDVWNNQKDSVDVPVIVGTTAQEVDIMPAKYDVIKSWGATEYEDYVTEKLGTFRPEIVKRALQLYPFTNGSSAEYLLTTMITDARMTCANDVFSKALASGSSKPVYRYIVTAKPSSPAEFLGFPFMAKYAFHCVDIFAFFDSMKDYISLQDSDKSFRNVLTEEILSFARTGEVSSPEWKPYPNSTAVLDTNITVVDSYQKERCEFWMSNGFFSYSWIN